MKSQEQRLRVLIGLTNAACALGLAASEVASAKPIPGDPPLSPAVANHSSKADVQSSSHTQAPDQPPVALTREVRTVTDHGDRTLAIVLAAAALGIALCGTGYAAVRLANLQRRIAGSSS